MKFLNVFILLFLVSCDPKGFGYKQNPAYVLDTAFKAIQNRDLESFLEVTGKEALCVYGSEEGMEYLKNNFDVPLNNLKLSPKVLDTIHYKNPVFVDFWSYYHERYQINITDKSNAAFRLKAIVDCEFGVTEGKSDKLVNQPAASYRVKECRLIKIVPEGFTALPVSERCAPLAVTL